MGDVLDFPGGHRDRAESSAFEKLLRKRKALILAQLKRNRDMRERSGLTVTIVEEHDPRWIDPQRLSSGQRLELDGENLEMAPRTDPGN